LITGSARTAELLRYVGRAVAAVIITRHGKIDLARIRQIEPVHESDEVLFGATATQARVAGLRLGDVGDEALPVVMPGIDNGLAG